MQPDKTTFSLWDEHGPKIVGLLVFVLALAAQPDNAIPGLGTRDGLYLSVGVGLARGWGTVFAHLPEASAVGWLGTGYSHVLSVLLRMWPEMPQGLTLIQLFNSLCLGGAAWGLSTLGRQLAFPYVWLDLGVAMMFATPAVLSLPGSAVPESMFALLAVACLAATVTAAADWRFALLSGALGGLATVTHGLGFVLLLSAVVQVGSGRKPGPIASLLVGAALPVAPWLWQSMAESPGALAVASMQMGLESGPRAGWIVLVEVIWGWHGALAQVAGLITLGFFGRGVMGLWPVSRGLAIALTGMVVSIGVFPGAPLGWAIIGAPFVIFACSVGARRLWGMDRKFRVPVALVVLVWFGVQLPRVIGGIVASPDADTVAATENVHRALASIRNEVPRNSVIASDADAAVFLYANHHTVPLSVLAETTDVRALCVFGVTHLAIVRQSSLPPRFVQARDDSTLVREFDLTDGPSLYRVSCN